MKYMPIAMLLFTMNLSSAFCPTCTMIPIIESSKIKSTSISSVDYEPLIDAIFFLESSRNTNAYNPSSGATGGLQITQILLDEYNSLTRKTYGLEEMKDFNKSREIFLYYTTHNHLGMKVKPKSWEQISKEWWGTDRLTEAYWQHVQEALNT
jgi:hypothetical protein